MLNLDEVIDLIRKAPDVETARTRLIKRFKLSDIQAQAILDMQLRRLAALERKKIEEEYKELQALIRELEGLLRSPKRMRQVVSDELLVVKEAYGDRRRTQIVFVKPGASKRSLLTTTDLAPDKAAWICVMPDGLISRTHEAELPRQSGNDAPAWLLCVNTRDTLYLVNDQGEAAALPVQAVPEADDVQNGVPLYKVSALKSEDRLAALFSLPPKAERVDTWFVLTATRQGMLKKSQLSELPGPSANTFTLVRVNDGDRLGWLRITDGQAEALLLTAQGMAIRFSEEEVRPMGLVAGGVMGIKLQAEDEIAGLEVLPRAGEVFMLASDGSAKRVEVSQFPRQGRYGQGVQAWKLPPKVRIIGMLVAEEGERATLFFSKTAPMMVRLNIAPLQGRAARGKSILELKAGNQLLALVAPWEPIRPGGSQVKPAPKKPRTSKPAAPVKATKTAAQTGKPSQPAAKKAGDKPARPRSAAKAAPEAAQLALAIGGQDTVKPAAASKPASPKTSRQPSASTPAVTATKSGTAAKTSARTSVKPAKTTQATTAARTATTTKATTTKTGAATTKTTKTSTPAKTSAKTSKTTKAATTAKTGATTAKTTKATTATTKKGQAASSSQPKASTGTKASTTTKTTAKPKTTGKAAQPKPAAVKPASKPASTKNQASTGKPAAKPKTTGQSGSKARKPAGSG